MSKKIKLAKLAKRRANNARTATVHVVYRPVANEVSTIVAVFADESHAAACRAAAEGRACGVVAEEAISLDGGETWCLIGPLVNVLLEPESAERDRALQKLSPRERQLLGVRDSSETE